MVFKDIMIQLSSYPDMTSAEAIEHGADFAQVMGARLTAFVSRMDMLVPRSPLVGSFLNVSGMVAAEKARSASNVETLIGLFERASSRRSIGHDHEAETCLTSLVAEFTTERARTHDLTIIPVGENLTEQHYVAESVVFGSGRPVLVVPDKPRTAAPLVIDTVGVAWDYSRPAARAVADAMPLLQRAKAVHVVTVTDEKSIETRRSAAELARHLACHRVEAEFEEERAEDRSIGDALEAYAAKRRLDVLVMGAFGHSRLRDFVLGGATRSLIANPSIPVLLSH